MLSKVDVPTTLLPGKDVAGSLLMVRDANFGLVIHKHCTDELRILIWYLKTILADKEPGWATQINGLAYELKEETMESSDIYCVKTWLKTKITLLEKAAANPYGNYVSEAQLLLTAWYKIILTDL